MKRKHFELQLFAEGGAAGAGDGSGGNGGGQTGKGNGSSGQSDAGSAGYSYAQAEQIADARADRASKEALTKYFESQGLTQDEVAAAISDFKKKKTASQPNVTAIEKERDAALAKVAEMENTNYLRDKGVKSDDLDYVLFKVSKNVDDKTDFRKAADAYLKENPRFTGQGYRVVSTGNPDGGSGTGSTANDQINASIRRAFGR